jgi:xyloglucan-specific endo-beta-1,4-glucanase
MGGVSPIGQSIGTVPVDGLDWDLWIGYNGPTKVFSFMAPQEPLTKFNSDIMQFFDYIAANEGFPASSQYLLSKSLIPSPPVVSLVPPSPRGVEFW